MLKVFNLKITFIFLFASLYSCTSPGPPLDTRPLVYKGKTLQNKNSGLTIIGDKTNGLMVVSNYIYHYAVIIPYAEGWEISVNQKYCLFASYKNYNISIELINNNEKDENKFLSEMKSNFLEKKDYYGVEKAWIFQMEQSNKMNVLETLVDVAAVSKSKTHSGLKQSNFYLTKSRGDQRYLLHFSALLKDVTKKEVHRVLGRMASSFSVDFQRKK